MKAAILDQRTVAGVGNIYADEALWRAQIHPLTPAAALGPDEVQALYRGIRRALQAGLRRQGSTLRDYRLPDGGTGGAQHEFKVYGRGGEPCDRCGTPIDKIRVAGRGTWYCPSCQRYASGEQGVEPPVASRGARARCSRRSVARRSGSAARSSRRSDRAASRGTRGRRRA